eukprot:Sspe_Gene.33916::Locus_16502_Transcript_1_1_Confidence_1.000_Length_2064::g.33916::m.33916
MLRGARVPQAAQASASPSVASQIRGHHRFALLSSLALVGLTMLVTQGNVVINLGTRDEPATPPHRKRDNPPHRSAGATPLQGTSHTPSTVKCLGVNQTLHGHVWGANIINMSCLYRNLVVADRKWWFISEDDPTRLLPAVSLMSKPILLGKKSFKRQYREAYAELQFSYAWRPKVVPAEKATWGGTGKVLGGLTVYYSPEVAPWNYAHTLFNELFPLFWGMEDHGVLTPSPRVVVGGALYNHPFQHDRKKWLPGNNGIASFTTEPPMWDTDLYASCIPWCRVESLLVGSGGRSWAFVTKGYEAIGGTDRWLRFRKHLLRVLRVPDNPHPKPSMVICDKKADSEDKKRGITNAKEIAAWVQDTYGIPARALLLSKLPVREQTALMANTTIYMCNEGTLGTAFFLMPPGSVWLSVMNIFRRHVEYDLYRPFSQRHLFWNTGGNIDWFAPATRWIKALYYDRFLIDDVRLDTTPGNYRNYLPNWSIRVNSSRLAPLLSEAVAFVKGKHERSDTDNRSVMGSLCAKVMEKVDFAQRLFTSIKCKYGMSWVCEYIVNGEPSLRRGHPKWSKCGQIPSLASLGISDPRDEWLKEEGIEESPRGFGCTPAFPCKDSTLHPCCTKDTT